MLSGGIPYGPTFRHYLSKLVYKKLCATFRITMAANEFQGSSYDIEGRHSSNEKAQMSDTHSKRGGWITFFFITGLSLGHNFIARKCVCMFVMKIAETCLSQFIWDRHVSNFWSCIFLRTFENRTNYAKIQGHWLAWHLLLEDGERTWLYIWLKNSISRASSLLK